jgi:hypothetical protein
MADLFDLFGTKTEGGPVGAPYTKGSLTSLEAAEAIADVAGRLRRRVYQHVVTCGATGTTDDAAEVALDMKHTTYTARRGELVKQGLVADSGHKGTTRSGRRATLWVAIRAVVGATNTQNLKEVSDLNKVRTKLKAKVGKMNEEQCAKVLNAIEGWRL